MTSKEAEHFLIDQNFTYRHCNLIDKGIWEHRIKNHLSLTDEFIQQNPIEAVAFIKRNLGI